LKTDALTTNHNQFSAGKSSSNNYWNYIKLCGRSTKGYALIEVLIAVTIISIVIMTVYSAVTSGSRAIASYKNITNSVIIAKSILSEFKLTKPKLDLSDKPVSGFEGFTYSRTIERYENPLLGPISANKLNIIVKWMENNHEKKYTLEYIFPEN
jgi:prepilin-type N-terminal cleavage/methylation domain-containing protein